MTTRKVSILLLALLAGPGYPFSVPTVASKRTTQQTRYYSSGGFQTVNDTFNFLSVTELKRLLSERGVDFRDCLEKRDLIDRLKNSKASSSSSAGGSRQPSRPLMDLSAHEQSLIETFKRVSPCVANIKTTTVVKAQDGLRLRSLEIPQGTGSGFLWDDKGHIVTNYHVISAGRKDGKLPSSVKVKLAGMAEVLEADIVGFEAEKDIAVLRVKDRRNLPRPIDVGTSNDLQVGQSVLAVGNPFGLDDTLTTGIVSALGRDVDGIGGRPIHGCIQTDAAINPGNSGGPLLDSRGRLIGVNTAIFSPNGAGNVGIGFAIPVDTVRRVVNQIILYGKVVRPTLGISIVDDRLVRNIGQQLGRPLEGCLVAEVMPNSPARLAGIQATSMSSDGSVILGDLITGVNGERVRQAEDLISAIEEKNEGDVVSLSVLRKCDPFKSETIQVTLTTRDKLKTNTSTNTATPRAGTRGSVTMPW
eukprot:CAMPEP_0170256552 /NCGR_PEP_ID=MMETSP0116_2-20130129/28129_1 /TAXON_ID=400756 /ORGANISM="Durinskia baltica, Strain CSIRO CS-38" /LENGTH=472 /DNA_ID=CAMNT_0010507561 /DNA_START=54 /DNA_END=1469 /DNA_ORIENTATION=+